MCGLPVSLNEMIVTIIALFCLVYNMQIGIFMQEDSSNVLKEISRSWLFSFFVPPPAD